MHLYLKQLVMRYTTLLSLLLLPVFLTAQSSSLPLNFSSYAIKLCVAKDESLTLTTRAGEVGVSSSIKGNWRRANVETTSSLSGPTLDQPNFFNKDTGFVSGFITNQASGEYNIIYHTTDGGATWKAVNFGQDGWIDDATNLDNGEAWLSVAGSGIAYTTNYGTTWKKFNIPDIKQRFAAIYFNAKREGIIGSLWNSIAYTTNNCQSWKQLPTPLDQKKYNKTNRESRPEITHVALFNNYLLVKQEEFVFYSQRDSINWVWLPKYSDFYTDPYNSALFFCSAKGNFIRSDSSFTPIHVFEETLQHYDAKCRNGSLFVVGQNSMVQFNQQNTRVATPFSANATTGAQPVYVGYAGNNSIGVQDNKIFSQSVYNGKWDYLFTFPYPLEKGMLSVTAEQELLYYTENDLFYFNFSGKQIRTVSKKVMIANFIANGIRKIVFSAGSRGCFHYYENKLEYTRQGDEFGNVVETSRASKGKTGLPEYEATIDRERVNAFVSQLPTLFNGSRETTLQDLNFTAEEYEQCKKDILEFQKYQLQPKKKKEPAFQFAVNNLDFSRLLNLVDSVKNIGNKELAGYLTRLSGFWSTTSFWKSIELINEKNEKLTLNSNYCSENPFYMPWNISLNGYTMVSTDFEINRFIENIYPGFLSKEGRVLVLHGLVKKLYQAPGDLVSVP
jgi:hypothetical protein